MSMYLYIYVSINLYIYNIYIYIYIYVIQYTQYAATQITANAQSFRWIFSPTKSFPSVIRRTEASQEEAEVSCISRFAWGLGLTN